MSSSSPVAASVVFFLLIITTGTASASRGTTLERPTLPKLQALMTHPSNFKEKLISEAPKYSPPTPDLSNRSSAYGDPADPPTPSMGQGPSLILLLFFVCLVIGLIVMIHKVFRPRTPPSTAASTLASSVPEVELQPIPSGRAPPHGEIILVQQPGAAPRPMWRALEK